MIFIKIIVPYKPGRNENLLQKAVRAFFGIVIPKANPDFEHKIQLVSYWLVEFLNKSSTPSREIGLGYNGDVLLKMPYHNNYGYWVDNNLTYNDFLNSFDIEDVTKECFEEKWNMPMVY